jgi:hypothetical protein
MQRVANRTMKLAGIMILVIISSVLQARWSSWLPLVSSNDKDYRRYHSVCLGAITQQNRRHPSLQLVLSSRLRQSSVNTPHNLCYGDVLLQETGAEPSRNECWTIYLQNPEFLLLHFPLARVQWDKNSTHTGLCVHMIVVLLAKGFNP